MFARDYIRNYSPPALSPPALSPPALNPPALSPPALTAQGQKILQKLGKHDPPLHPLESSKVESRGPGSIF